MLLNRYVQYCKCKGRLREGGEKGKRQRVRQTATHISYLAACTAPQPMVPTPPPFHLSLPDLRANDSAGHGTLPGRQWTSTYVCCRQCSVKFALFSNPLSPTVTPLPSSPLRHPLLICVETCFVVVAREHVFLLLCCL